MLERIGLGYSPVSIGGKASATGFTLSVGRVGYYGYSSVTYTVGSESDVTGPWEDLAFAASIIATAVVSFLMFPFVRVADHVLLTALRVMVSTIGVWSLMFLGFEALPMYRGPARWHCCEHRSMYLILRGLPPTRENFRCVPSVAGRCGTVLWVLFGLVSCATALQSGPSFLLCLSCGSAFMLVAVAPDLPYCRFLLFPMVLAGAPALGLALLLQRCICLREPSPEQVDETLAGLQAFYRECPEIWRWSGKEDNALAR